jgi:spore maturation protein SpmB
MAYLSNLVIISTEPETGNLDSIGEITPLIVSIYGKPGKQFAVVHLMFHYPMSLP